MVLCVIVGFCVFLCEKMHAHRHIHTLTHTCTLQTQRCCFLGTNLYKQTVVWENWSSMSLYQHACMLSRFHHVHSL